MSGPGSPLEPDGTRPGPADRRRGEASRRGTDRSLAERGPRARGNGRPRPQSLLAAERRPLELLASGASLSAILDALCSSIDAQCLGIASAVLLMDADGERLWPTAGPHLPSGWTQAHSPVMVGPRSEPCGAAAFRKQRVIAADLATDPPCATPRRSIALGHGFRAEWAQPLLSEDGTVLGTFAVCCATPREPDERELRLVEGAGHVAVIAIEGDRAQAARRDVRRQAEERARNEILALREEIDRSSMFEEIVGSSEPLRRVLAQVSKVAGTDSTVLVLGETGTGKELIARAIHRRSSRAGEAFIRVACAAIAPSLVASELFGHEKGAFTGAVQRRLGRFEAANGGTIFLDEVGDLPMETQIALLRVLQERELERIGSSRPISVDVRVVAATNRDLEVAVAAGSFRQDLFYRVNVFPIRIPPLRERKDDIPLLVQYLIERYSKKAGKRIRNISRRTLDAFTAYRWPGNVRELQNVVERAVILCEGDTFLVDESWLGPEATGVPGPAATLAGELADREREIIEAALTSSRGRVSGPAGAAAKLGVPRQTLESKIRALHINKHRFKPP